MSIEGGWPVVESEDADIVSAALDVYIEQQRGIDSETLDPSASNVIRRAADARQRLDEDLRPRQDLSPELQKALTLGHTVLGNMPPDELAAALRLYGDTPHEDPDIGKRALYLAGIYER